MTLYPAWFKPGRDLAWQRENVLAGLHPFGYELGPEKSRCFKCKWRSLKGERSSLGSNRRKCHRYGFWDAGAKSDVIGRWRGCEHFEATPEERRELR